MRKSFILSVLVPIAIYGDIHAESLLQVASFPGTFADLPLAERMAIKAEGYEDFDPVYENGVCVSGCAYKGITLEEEEAMIRRNTEQATTKLRQYLAIHPDVAATYAAGVSGSGQNAAPTAQNAANNTLNTRTCAQFSSTIRPGLDAVMQAPLDIDLLITSDFGSRSSPCSGCSSTHRGLDFSAPVGTNVYAPANGTVTVVKTEAKGCGKQIQIKHPDGLITQYCHLSEQNVTPGQYVQGGCLIGRTGNSGSSTGPHLHYALMNAPQSFIDPLWQTNMLGRPYRFKNSSAVSPEHSGKNLPGRIN